MTSVTDEIEKVVPPKKSKAARDTILENGDEEEPAAEDVNIFKETFIEGKRKRSSPQTEQIAKDWIQANLFEVEDPPFLNMSDIYKFYLEGCISNNSSTLQDSIFIKLIKEVYPKGVDVAEKSPYVGLIRKKKTKSEKPKSVQADSLQLKMKDVIKEAIIGLGNPRKGLSVSSLRHFVSGKYPALRLEERPNTFKTAIVREFNFGHIDCVKGIGACGFYRLCRSPEEKAEEVAREKEEARERLEKKKAKLAASKAAREGGVGREADNGDGVRGKIENGGDHPTDGEAGTEIDRSDKKQNGTSGDGVGGVEVEGTEALSNNNNNDDDNGDDGNNNNNNDNGGEVNGDNVPVADGDKVVAIVDVVDEAGSGMAKKKSKKRKGTGSSLSSGIGGGEIAKKKKKKKNNNNKNRSKVKKGSKFNYVHSHRRLEDQFPLAMTYNCEPKETTVSKMSKYILDFYRQEIPKEKLKKCLDIGKEKGFWDQTSGQTYCLTIEEFDPSADDDLTGMIMNAIVACTEPKVSSALMLKKYMIAYHPEFKVQERPKGFKAAIARAIAGNKMRQISGIGAIGSFQLIDQFRPSPAQLQGSSSASLSDYDATNDSDSEERGEEEADFKSDDQMEKYAETFKDAYCPRPTKSRGRKIAAKKVVERFDPAKATDRVQKLIQKAKSGRVVKKYGEGSGSHLTKGYQKKGKGVVAPPLKSTGDKTTTSELTDSSRSRSSSKKKTSVGLSKHGGRRSGVGGIGGEITTSPSGGKYYEGDSEDEEDDSDDDKENDNDYDESRSYKKKGGGNKEGSKKEVAGKKSDFSAAKKGVVSSKKGGGGGKKGMLIKKKNNNNTSPVVKRNVSPSEDRVKKTGSTISVGKSVSVSLQKLAAEESKSSSSLQEKKKEMNKKPSNAVVVVASSAADNNSSRKQRSSSSPVLPKEDGKATGGNGRSGRGGRLKLAVSDLKKSSYAEENTGDSGQEEADNISAGEESSSSHEKEETTRVTTTHRRCKGSSSSKKQPRTDSSSFEGRKKTRGRGKSVAAVAEEEKEEEDNNKIASGATGGKASSPVRGGRKSASVTTAFVDKVGGNNDEQEDGSRRPVLNGRLEKADGKGGGVDDENDDDDDEDDDKDDDGVGDVDYKDSPKGDSSRNKKKKTGGGGGRKKAAGKRKRSY